VLQPIDTQKAKWTKWAQTLRRSRSGMHPGLLLPSFFVIGPPRTGTSWLYQILKERTVLPSLIKETRFSMPISNGDRLVLGTFREPKPEIAAGRNRPDLFCFPRGSPTD